MKKTQEQGFSLIELATVMVIIAVILGVSFSSIMSNLGPVKKQHTEEKLEVIKTALLGFLLNNKRLPCPADGSLAPSNVSFGLEGFDTGTNRCNSTVPMEFGNTISGVVPIVTLRLSSQFMLDGWGRRMTYVVDKRLAGNVVGTESFYDTAVAELNVRISSSSTIDDVAYVTFSHGPNGHGAWLENGGSRLNSGVTPDTEEYENCHLDQSLAHGGGFDEEFVQWADETRFDDILDFATKAELVVELGGVFSTRLCPDSADYVGGALNTLCHDSPNKLACKQLLKQTRERCVFVP